MGNKPIVTQAMKKILTIEGRWWKEIYEEKEDGTRVLLWSDSEKKMDWNEATSVTLMQDMPWSEFCRLYKSDSSYSS